MFTDRSAFKLNKGNEANINIGARTLEQHLIEADIRPPFYIKEILSKQDWTIFEKEHQKKKRRPYAPKAMVGLILYGLMQGLSSLRDLERLARVDLGCIFITDGICPDFSSIGYFIRRHQAILTEVFFFSLTKSILKITRSGVRSLAGDGTIIEAASSRYKLMRQEAIEEKHKALISKLSKNPQDQKLAHDCPLKTRCTSGKNGRQLKRYDGDELKEGLRLVMEHPKAQKRLKQRKAMVEPVFSHIKLRQNLNRFKRKGIYGVKIEFSLQMMAYNISRAIAQANRVIA